VFVIASLFIIGGCTANDTSKTKAAPAADTATTMPQASPAPMAQPDPQMKAVLDEFAELSGKPVETLTAKEARQQPTPADAVKALMKQQGKSTASEPGARSGSHP
jgi:acetyl esterase